MEGKISIANTRELAQEYESWAGSIKSLGSAAVAGAESSDIDHLVAIRYHLIDGAAHIDSLLNRVDRALTDLGYDFPERSTNDDVAGRAS